jgi:cell division protein FtsZ
VVVDAAGHDANVIFGAVIDEHMGDGLSITVIATGFGKGEPKQQQVQQRGMGLPAAAHAQPRIYPMVEPRERIARPAAVIASSPTLEEPSTEDESVVAANRPGYRIASPSPRRPFGGRAIVRDNMDVPAFMRKQMD